MTKHRPPRDRFDSSAFATFSESARPCFNRAIEHEVETLRIGFPSVDSAFERALGIGATPGRQWRPLLALAAGHALGVRHVEDLMRLAMAVELTHTASLILDDLPCMDDDARRRGEPATHRLVGTGGATLMAIGLLARSAALLGQAGPAGGELARRWGQAFGMQGMCGGQAVDLALGADARGEHRRLYRRKSTALVAFALEGSALATGASAATRTALFRFGRDLGWAYQVADDCADELEDTGRGRSPQARAAEMGPRILDRALGRLEHSGILSEPGFSLLGSAAVTVAAFPMEVARC